MDLSIIIPSRNEMFLKRTIDDILEHMRGDTEIIVVLDGTWADPPIPDHPKVTIIHHAESIGQRAATNEAVRLSKAKYILKCDAHTAWDEGFDVKLMADMKDDWTVVPVMRNLHAFNWVCKKCGDVRYQGPTPISCPKCDNKNDFERDVVWIPKTNPRSSSYCFDSEPHFQYFKDFKSRPEAKGDLVETMSLQGSCFMLTREKYWELNICDEKLFGSWGSQGIEVAVKTWTSGGRVVCNKKTWYAHMFRTQGGDFGFPYPQSGRQVAKAKHTARDIFFNNKWPLQKYPLSWLLDKFWPVPGWTEQQLIDLKKGEAKVGVGHTTKPISHSSPLSKGIVYYTDNRCPEPLNGLVKQYLNESELKIVSVSLSPIDFGENIVLPLERSYLSMFKQILAGIEASDADVLFLCEHDVLYNKEHFEFIPPTKDLYYYNTNNWQLRASDGHAVYWHCQKVSQLCAYRELLLKHYRERVRRVEAEGFTRAMGFEPGTHNRKERVDDIKCGWWATKIPNLDVRHQNNLTSSRWSPDQFRNPCKDWQESHLSKLPGWENLESLV
jgi:glycosyltransferase involved in cell wall biosynthesis